MNVSANLYFNANRVQRYEASEIFHKYANTIKWRDDGLDTILDIGSGPGDVTVDYIVPILPKSFKKLVGVDLSSSMVKHANEMFSTSRISFEQWSMTGDVQQLLRNHEGGFDHVFSSFTLHWDNDQRRIVQNIYDLLTPNGDCLLIFLGTHVVYDVTLALSKKQKWRQIANGCEQMTIPFQNKKNRVEIFGGLLRDAGFRQYTIDVKNSKYIYGSIEEIRRNITAVNPIMEAMSQNDRIDYFNDYIKMLFKLGVAEISEDGSNCEFHSKYQLMIVYAQK